MPGTSRHSFLLKASEVPGTCRHSFLLKASEVPGTCRHSFLLQRFEVPGTSRRSFLLKPSERRPGFAGREVGHRRRGDSQAFFSIYTQRATALFAVPNSRLRLERDDGPFGSEARRGGERPLGATGTCCEESRRNGEFTWAVRAEDANESHVPTGSTRGVGCPCCKSRGVHRMLAAAASIGPEGSVVPFEAQPRIRDSNAAQRVACRSKRTPASPRGAYAQPRARRSRASSPTVPRGRNAWKSPAPRTAAKGRNACKFLVPQTLSKGRKAWRSLPPSHSPT